MKKNAKFFLNPKPKCVAKANVVNRLRAPRRARPRVVLRAPLRRVVRRPRVVRPAALRRVPALRPRVPAPVPVVRRTREASTTSRTS